MLDDVNLSCMLVLDGAFVTTTDLGQASLDHENELPVLYLGLPGRLLNLNITFRYDELVSSLSYVNYHYLADIWVATSVSSRRQRLITRDVTLCPVLALSEGRPHP